MNLRACPLQSLERTPTATADQPRITNSERFGLGFDVEMVFKEHYIIISVVKIVWFLWYFNAFVFQLALIFCFTKQTDSCLLEVHPLPFPIIWWHTHSHRGSSLTFPMTFPEQRSFFSVRLFMSLSGCLSPCVTDQRTQRRMSHEFYSAFMILDLCPRCIPAVLPTSPK